MRDYHDAILDKIVIDSTSDTAYFHIRLCTEDNILGIIKAEQLHDIKCPRFMPWGRSISINEIQLIDLGSQRKMEIKMQSGDTIEVWADRFHEE